MSEFLNFINKTSPLTKEAEGDISSRLRYKKYSKGEIINKEGEVCKKFSFIDKGLVKTLYYHKNRSFILRFFSENSTFTIIDSFFNQTPSAFVSIALEETYISYIEYKDIEVLSRKHHSFETFLRKTFSMASLVAYKRLRELFEKDATKQYRNFEQENNHLLQRISLGDISAYLGISQVTLSRIRAKKK